MVAGTFFAIPPGPRVPTGRRPSAGEIARGSQPSWPRRRSSTWMKNSTVFIGPSKGRRSNGGPLRTVETSWSHDMRSRGSEPHLLRVGRQRGPDQAGPAVGPPLPHDDVRREIGRDPTLAQRRGVGTMFEKEIAERLALLLREGGWRHRRSLGDCGRAHPMQAEVAPFGPECRHGVHPGT